MKEYRKNLTLALSLVLLILAPSVSNFGQVGASPSSGLVWHLRNSNTSGYGEFSLYYGSSNVIPLVGDWDGDGVNTPGYFDSSTASWYLRNSNTTGGHDILFNYGNAGDVPLVGDWNGDGIDTPGVYRSPFWYLRNSNSTGVADISLHYGNTGDVPLVGDWNGDGIDTPGVYRSPFWYLRNSNSTGVADISLHYGNTGDVPLVGDWNGDGIDTPGVYRSPFWYLRNSNTSGVGNISFHYGDSGDIPIVGDWNRDGVDSPGVIQQSAPPPNGNNLGVRYVDQVYVQQQPESGYWNHCGPSSTAMLLHYEGKESRDVLYNRQATLDLVCEVKVNCSGAAYVNYNDTIGIMPALQRRGVNTYYDGSPTFSEIKQSIDHGHPVILGVYPPTGGHFIVATGYSGNNIVIVNDPFGGWSWWNDWGQANLPATTQPKLKGQAVQYDYAAANIRFAVFVNGAVMARESTSLVVDSTETNLVDNNLAFDFSTFSTQQITITYSPQIAPSHDYSQFEAPLEAFALTAQQSQSNVASLEQGDSHYHISTKLDSDALTTWGVPLGEIGQNLISSTTESKRAKYVLAYWASAFQKWIEIPSELDLESGSLKAEVDNFGEFAIFVKLEHVIYIPIAMR